MPLWSGLGHAMRRRSGMPMNHHESVGAKVNNMPTPEDVIASAEHANSPRKYVGQTAGVANISGAPLKGKLMPKKNTQAGDPTAGGKANKKNVLVNNAAASERMGARYTIGAKFPAVHSIEASQTMNNAKIVPSVHGKQSPNFDYGVEGNY